MAQAIRFTKTSKKKYGAWATLPVVGTKINAKGLVTTKEKPWVLYTPEGYKVVTAKEIASKYLIREGSTETNFTADVLKTKKTGGVIPWLSLVNNTQNKTVYMARHIPGKDLGYFEVYESLKGEAAKVKIAGKAFVKMFVLTGALRGIATTEQASTNLNKPTKEIAIPKAAPKAAPKTAPKAAPKTAPKAKVEPKVVNKTKAKEVVNTGHKEDMVKVFTQVTRASEIIATMGGDVEVKGVEDASKCEVDMVATFKKGKAKVRIQTKTTYAENKCKLEAAVKTKDGLKAIKPSEGVELVNVTNGLVLKVKTILDMAKVPYGEVGKAEVKSEVKTTKVVGVNEKAKNETTQELTNIQRAVLSAKDELASAGITDVEVALGKQDIKVSRPHVTYIISNQGDNYVITYKNKGLALYKTTRGVKGRLVRDLAKDETEFGADKDVRAYGADEKAKVEAALDKAVEKLAKFGVEAVRKDTVIECGNKDLGNYSITPVTQGYAITRDKDATRLSDVVMIKGITSGMVRFIRNDLAKVNAEKPKVSMKTGKEYDYTLVGKYTHNGEPMYMIENLRNGKQSAMKRSQLLLLLDGHRVDNAYSRWERQTRQIRLRAGGKMQEVSGEGLKLSTLGLAESQKLDNKSVYEEALKRLETRNIVGVGDLEQEEAGGLYGKFKLLTPNKLELEVNFSVKEWRFVLSRLDIEEKPLGVRAKEDRKSKSRFAADIVNSVLKLYDTLKEVKVEGSEKYEAVVKGESQVEEAELADDFADIDLLDETNTDVVEEKALPEDTTEVEPVVEEELDDISDMFDDTSDTLEGFGEEEIVLPEEEVVEEVEEEVEEEEVAPIIDEEDFGDEGLDIDNQIVEVVNHEEITYDATPTQDTGMAKATPETIMDKATTKASKAEDNITAEDELDLEEEAASDDIDDIDDLEALFNALPGDIVSEGNKK